MEKTIKNLAKAFVGESQARNRYTNYAKAAKKEGYEQIAAIFLETAEQEREHAKWLMRMINQLKQKNDGDYKEIEIEAPVPTIMEDTATNLKAAIEGENYEYSSMYPEFAKTARKEGLDKIADRLEAIAKAETHHEERYKKLLKELEKETLFEKTETTTWICRKCGYMHEGAKAVEECPSCGHPQAYFQLKCETY
ncbi:MAG: rubrerythrin family protein [Candidatus Moranbacteria bacterium]|nr:rubrerythrin family protein [Candidatus Moranbacteria bacterium]